MRVAERLVRGSQGQKVSQEQGIKAFVLSRVMSRVRWTAVNSRNRELAVVEKGISLARNLNGFGRAHAIRTATKFPTEISSGSVP